MYLLFFRSKAAFDWREMKVKFHTEEILKLKMKIWNHLASDPIFARNVEEENSLDAKRAITFKRVQRLVELDFVPFETSMMEPEKSISF